MDNKLWEAALRGDLDTCKGMIAADSGTIEESNNAVCYY
jgi:hypothetical protein